MLCADVAPLHLLHFSYNFLVEQVEVLEGGLLVVALLQLAVLQFLSAGLHLQLPLELALQLLAQVLPQQIDYFFGVVFGREQLLLQFLVGALYP